MVKIIEIKISQNKKGETFVGLKLQGDVEAIQSQQTGDLYLSAKTCFISSTFDEATARTLIGMSMPGSIERVATSEPYQYTVKATGEVITLMHRYKYRPETVPVNPASYQLATDGDFIASE